MENTEAIYDEQIFPLMGQIIQIAKENNIPFFAAFQLHSPEDDLFCTSQLVPNPGLLEALSILYDCRQGDNINIDKFLFWILKKAKERGHESIFLKQLENTEMERSWYDG